MKSLVNSRWHFILHEQFGPQLYDRMHDREELHDLAATPEGQRAVAEFKKTLQDLGATFPRRADASQKNPGDDK